MRKNAPRKWLHAILDLLPVILIPVFMIYSHRHTIDSGSITREESSFYTLKQNVINGKPLSSSGSLPNINLVNCSFDGFTDGYCCLFRNSVDDDYCFALDIGTINTVQPILYLSFDFAFDIDGWNLDTTYLYFDFDSWDFEVDDSSLINEHNGFYLTSSITQPLSSFIFYCNSISSVSQRPQDICYIKDIQLFNLTEIFGSGNEPTKEEFESLLTQDYYDYGVDYDIVFGTHSVTYNDTDIMSQMMYQLYNAVDKYFNMGNVFNMTGVYNWFNLNIFNGNAPIIMYIVWNIALYELVMDLMFLLYALFMWFVDWCKSLIERTYDVGRGK